MITLTELRWWERAFERSGRVFQVDVETWLVVYQFDATTYRCSHVSLLTREALAKVLIGG